MPIPTSHVRNFEIWFRANFLRYGFMKKISKLKLPHPMLHKQSGCIVRHIKASSKPRISPCRALKIAARPMLCSIEFWKTLSCHICRVIPRKARFESLKKRELSKKNAIGRLIHFEAIDKGQDVT